LLQQVGGFPSQLGGDLVDPDQMPLPHLGIDEETFVVYLDGVTCERCRRHRVIPFFPAEGMSGPTPGTSRPGSSACQ
jgi:hypothetical protein